LSRFLREARPPQIDIPILGDGLFELDETFTVILSNPINLMLADAAGDITIQNDDVAPLVSVTASDPQGAEQAQNSVSFTVNRSANLVGDIAVNLSWSGTAGVRHRTTPLA
jgi:hypothetical protein